MDGRHGVRLYPVRVLKEQAMALDAAMLVASTAPEVGAVHKLRTSTRRVEAALLLLQVLRGGEGGLALPDAAAEVAEVRRLLKRVRRAAGKVRDLDVQVEAIQLDAPAKSAVHEGSTGDKVRKQAKRLRKHLEARRERGVEKLVAVLKSEEEALAAALRALEQALKGAGRVSAPAALLLARVEAWYERQTRELLKGKASEEALHAVRKAAKLSRYLCEASQAIAAREAASKYEEIQEAGGRWHDWMLLEELAASFVGEKELLTERYRTRCEAALAEYQLRLGL